MASATTAGFRPVNMNLLVQDGSSSSKIIDENTPTTPKPSARFADADRKAKTPATSNPITPTRHDFGGIPGQRALPNTPFAPADIADTRTHSREAPGLAREDSHKSIHSQSQMSDGSGDVEMADEDEVEQEDSDNDSVTSDSQRPTKKKKGQRFFCTDFSPCNLSFTRSEHLARHIRKHTGERPFQCHCSRRFSRLDNLRQHAQTVHVNEDIPGDSLAATGTRFQRQIRTDRVRPPNARSRASTTTSGGGSIGHSHSHNRGHSRNLSASSVASTTSNVSSLPDELTRKRPASLAMAQDGPRRSSLTLDTFVPPGGSGGVGSPTQNYAYYRPQSPGGYSTPTSAGFSTGQSSPRVSVQSPSSLSRSNFYNGTRASARRLSVPSASVFQQAQPAGYPPLYYSAMPGGAASTYSNSSSIMASPTTSGFFHGRRDSDAELDWRRRTWHPGTYATYTQRPATSGLTYQQTPDDSRPTLAPQAAASQITRLPGIESFDHAPASSSTVPPLRLSSPMQIDNANRPPVYPGPVESSATGPDGRRNNSVWEAGLHQNLNRLDLANNTPPKQGSTFIEQAAARPSFRPGHAHSVSVPNFSHPQPLTGPPAYHGMPPPSADARRDRRQGMYGGPYTGVPPPGSQPIMIAQPHRTSPDSGSSDGVPTPSTSQGRELHPAILHPNGVVEYQQPTTALTEEQQRAMQAHAYAAKPEPIRIDSGSHVYGHPTSGAAPVTYVLQSGHEPHGYPGYPPPSRPPHAMDRLDALAAVATSEDAQKNT